MGLEVEASVGRGSPGVAQMKGLVWESLLTSSWGSTTGTHLKIRREVSPTVTQRFSLWEGGGGLGQSSEERTPPGAEHIWGDLSKWGWCGFANGAYS